MEIWVDIDRTLCRYERVNGAKKAVPRRDVIDQVNHLRESGNRIVIWTARQNATKRDVKKFTIEQLKSWGVNYDEIRWDKPIWGMLIDDRVVNVEHWMQGIPVKDMGEDFGNR